MTWTLQDHPSAQRRSLRPVRRPFGRCVQVLSKGLKVIRSLAAHMLVGIHLQCVGPSCNYQSKNWFYQKKKTIWGKQVGYAFSYSA
jgi:hypothetical protein